MTNVEKSKQLIQDIYPSDCMGDFGLKEMLVLEAMKWKEQQMIEKAAEWIRENIVDYSEIWMGGWNRDSYDQDVVDNSLIRDFKKAMEK